MNAKEPEGHAFGIHDELFFLEDGDCVFLAEGVLFKLHKWALCRDPDSMFRDMFSIPQGPEAKGDLDPILLSDDTAEEFRSLCWAVYALPTEIQMQTEHGMADLTRLVAVAKMSHKYGLPSFETWALQIIWIHCQPGMDYLDDCPQDMLCRIFEAAEKGGRQDLCSFVEERWLRRLKSGHAGLREALDFGAMHNRRDFLGKAYYQQALNMKSLGSPMGASGATDFQSQPNLTHEQMHRLLSGYCSISLAWDRFRRMNIPHTDDCFQSWASLAHFLVDDRPLDIIKGLEASKNKRNCEHVNIFIDGLIAAMPDHFLGKA